MTQEEMLSLVVKNGYGLEMTIERLDDENNDQKLYELGSFVVLLETEEDVMFIYFDEEETFTYNKKSGNLFRGVYYEDIIYPYLNTELSYYNYEYLDDYLSNNDYFLLETEKGLFIVNNDTDEKELKEMGIK